jgi:CRISPR/Cas system-associated endoribonuclease Cas2
MAFLSLEDIKSFFNELYKTLKEYSQKIKTSLEIINNMINKEKTFVSASSTVSAKASTLKNFFDGYKIEISKIANITLEIDEITQKYESLCQCSQGLGEKTKGIDEFNKNAWQIFEKLSDLITSLDKLDNELKRICQEKIDYIRAYQINVMKMLDVLKEAGEDATAFNKAFKETAEEAVECLNDLSLGRTVKLKWAEIDEDLELLKKQLLERVKRIISEDEFRVLLLIIEKSAIQQWLALSEIIDDVASILGKTSKQALEIVEKLAEKKLIKLGVSIPI